MSDTTEQVTVTAQRPPPRALNGLFNPRILVTLNHVVLTNAAEVTITRQNSYQVDTFSVRVAFSDDSPQNQVWFAGQIQSAPLNIAIGFAMDATGFGPPEFLGVVDKITFSPFGGGVTLAGRNLAGPMVDAQLIYSYPNKTSSEIVTTIGQARGLTVNAQATTTLAGHYYESSYILQTFGAQGANRTEWELLTALAEREQFALYMTGQTLNFLPVATDFTFPISATSNTSPVSDVMLEANLRLWRPIKETVISRHPATKETVTGSASAPGFGELLEFKHAKPAWDASRSDAWAQHELTQVLQQRATLRFRIPHQKTRLTPRSTVTASGFGPPMDASYFVRTIETRFDMRGGWDTVNCVLTNPLTGEQAAADGGDE